MTDTPRDALDLREEDRLPWLEPVEDERTDGGVSPMKLAAAVLAALVALGLVVAGIWWLRERNQPEGGVGNGALIAAPEGDYKVKPDEPGGMKVEGQGDSTFAASEGAETRGRIDTRAVPEAPVAGKAAGPTRPAAPVATGSAPIATARLPDAAALASGRVVQLGAFNSAAVADSEWNEIRRRFTDIASLPKTVTTVSRGGKTLYRLRLDAGSASAARDICARLTAAGQACAIARA